MELELPNVDAKNGQIHGNLLTTVASTSLTDTSCCLRGTPWIRSDHHLPQKPLGHQSNMRALWPKKNHGVTEHYWDHSISLPEDRLAQHIRKNRRVAGEQCNCRCLPILRQRHSH